MNEAERKIVDEVIQEISNRFENWDNAINARQQPVTIQDLDYWRKRLSDAIELFEVTI
jgi:hypothetical protein